MQKDKSSNILGIGNDIIEVERIREGINTHGQRFLDRLFTLKEQQYCQKYQDPIPHFAGRFAAKEAISKAFGTGFGKNISWLDIEILSNNDGAPLIEFSEELKKLFNNPHMLLSISHCKLYATAVALWVF